MAPTGEPKNPLAKQMVQNFHAAKATVGVVGLGYVGLPLVREMHNAGFKVVGFDIDQSKITALKAGKSYLAHLGDDLFKMLSKSKKFKPTTKEADLGACDAICLCVPTPLGNHHEPDLTYVEKSTETAARAIVSAKKKTPTLVSLESTTYPGTTREICKTILDKHGL